MFWFRLRPDLGFCAIWDCISSSSSSDWKQASLSTCVGTYRSGRALNTPRFLYPGGFYSPRAETKKISREIWWEEQKYFSTGIIFLLSHGALMSISAKNRAFTYRKELSLSAKSLGISSIRVYCTHTLRWLSDGLECKTGGKSIESGGIR